MSIIKVENPNTTEVPKTFLSVNQAIGVGTLYIKNPNDFQANWALQLGETGEAESEIVLANSSTPSGTQIVLSGTTRYAHPADTPVYAIKYDQVVFTKSASGTSAGTSGALTNGTVAISPNLGYTQFDDTTGVSTDYYRSYYYNSSTAGSTSYSDWVSPGGYSFYSLISIRERVKDKLWDSSYIQNDAMIDNWVNEWKDKMVNSVISVNEDYALGTVDVGFGTSGLGTVTTADFYQPRRFWVTTNGVDYYQSMKQNINDFRPGEIYSSTNPYHAWQGDSVFQVKPDGVAGTARITFYRFGTTMVNDTDELPVPMRSYTDSFVDFALAQALFKDGKVNEYDRKIAEANTAKQQFVGNLAPRDKTGIKLVKINDAITGEDGIY